MQSEEKGEDMHGEMRGIFIYVFKKKNREMFTIRAFYSKNKGFSLLKKYNVIHEIHFESHKNF